MNRNLKTAAQTSITTGKRSQIHATNKPMHRVHPPPGQILPAFFVVALPHLCHVPLSLCNDAACNANHNNQAHIFSY
jgi:hypothetical protein